MKTKILKLIFAVTLAAMAVLSSCSSGDRNPQNDESPSVDSTSSSTPDETEPIASEPESNDTDSSSRDEEASAVQEEPEKVRIDADGGLRMRSGPGTDYDVITVIPKNAYAEVATGEEDNPDWLYVSYAGDSGWVSKEFISYKSGAVSAAEYNSTAWAKVYHDYLSTFEPMTYTSTMYGGTYTVAGRITDEGEKIACSAIDFQRIDGYGYPVLICWDGEPLDAEGNMDGPMFAPIVYLVENKKLTRIDYSNPKLKTFIISDGYPEPKGSSVAHFDFKPENGGDPKDTKKALAWLKSQM